MWMINALLANDRFSALWAKPELPILCLLPPCPPETTTQVLLVRYRSDFTTRLWLRGVERRKPTWLRSVGAWRVPVAWLDRLVWQSLRDVGGVYLLHLYNPHQRCTASCRRAKGLVCECPCMGDNHGSDADGAERYRIGEAFTFTANGERFSCRELRSASCDFAAVG